MKTMTATEVSRNFSNILDSLEFSNEEIIIVRNKHSVARLIPGAPIMNAYEAMSDLFKTLPYDDGEEWLKDCEKFDTPIARELKDPWE